MAHAITIYLPEMRELLEAHKFRMLPPLPRTNEIVFGKRMDWQRRIGLEQNADGTIGTLEWSLPLTIRVYTSILTSGTSRGVGEDAIRVNVWLRKDSKLPNGSLRSDTFMVGGSKRVHRVENWRHNLTQRLMAWTECLQPFCPDCGAPMVLRTSHVNPPKFDPFYGCVRYPACRGTQKVEK